jgi:hypothetical protein
MTNGWDQWREHVLRELAATRATIDQLEAAVTQLRVDLAALRERLKIWGAVAAGLVPLAGLIGTLVGRMMQQ